jgi:hypothetical protein
MAGRKRHSAEDIVRKLRRADELTAEGKTGEEIAAELGISPAISGGTIQDQHRPARPNRRITTGRVLVPA